MKITKIDHDGLIFDNGFRIEDHHEADCCETVYADWEHLKTYNVLPHTGEKTDIFQIDFDEDLKIEGVKEQGFCLIAKDESKWFVPCYNQQNGYYSSNLALVIEKNGVKTGMDITEFVQDQID